MAADLEIAEYLEDEGVGTVGTDLFAGEVPADVANAVVVTQFPGRAPELTLASDGWTHEFPRLQIRVRNTDEGNALTKAAACGDALSKVANQTIEGVRYRSVNMVQSPGLLFRDEQNRPNYGFNVEVERETQASPVTVDSLLLETFTDDLLLESGIFDVLLIE